MQGCVRPLTDACRSAWRGGWAAAVILAMMGWIGGHVCGAEPGTENGMALPWPDRPLTLLDCLNLAEAGNGTVAAARKELEAAEGIVIQTRAVIFPTVRLGGEFSAVDESALEVAETPFGRFNFGQTETWEVGVRLVQSIYEGGRLAAAVRSARHTREAAIQRFQTVVLDTLLEVRVAYYDALLAQEQIVVQEASVTLLERELLDNQRRFDAGSVPRFNVLRAEVELASARPRLIRARNAWRNARTHLAHLLGHRVPDDITGDVPLRLADRLEAPPFEVDLGQALALAQSRRTELKALRATEELRRQGVVVARSGHRPSLQAFAGYGVRRSQFGERLDSERHGWNVGVQAQWNLFDGRLTRGRVIEAAARLDQAGIDLENADRQISVEVRTAHANFSEAGEVLASQERVVEQATEALRLATARAEAGSGTQLDVLSAQTALTEARTTQNLGRRDYLVAWARLLRAAGLDHELERRDLR
ncbi:MAG: TolC family protein [Verrucomicrobiae bacterium]|nr:TolC family protein [Verrucomicrobiae bacterium]